VGVKKALYAGILVVLAVLFRTSWHLAPNIEFVTAASMLAATYLGAGYGLLVPLIIMFVSDSLLGNSDIFIFTWSAFILIGAANGLCFRKREAGGAGRMVAAQTAFGIGATLFFYLYTNFGVWLLDGWAMYARNMSGLMQSYWMGLPFLRLQLAGNLVFVPLTFTLVELGMAFWTKRWREFNFPLRS
jgi:uncharacterized membrane protein